MRIHPPQPPIGQLLLRCAQWLGIGLLLASCASSPLGRSQLVLFPESQMAEMGTLAYREMRKETPVSKEGKANDYVSCVARAIIEANPELASQQWEITLFASDQANAFALPGGKLGVYSGMLKVAENQDQLAAVVGHELAHVVARHGNERVSSSYATQGVLQAVTIAAGGASGEKRQLLGLLGLGAQVGVLLPFGRAQETEADLLGLDYMAKAGFRPAEASNLWRNMSKQGGSRQPGFLSTHPAPADRIKRLDERAPAAEAVAQTARANGRRPNCA